MAKFKLVPNPTFKAKVEIPVAGGDSIPVEFTFKHRTKKEVEEFIDTRKGKTDLESFLYMVEGWELEQPFDEEAADLLLQNYIGAGAATFRVFLDELVKTRAKN